MLSFGLFVFLCAVVTWVIYGRAAGYGFVNYDDGKFIFNNPHVTAGLSWESLNWAFRHFYLYWSPIAWVLHMAVVQFFGDSGGAHHMVSVALHLMNSLLCFSFLFLISDKFWRSAAVSLLFLVHPIHVETVLWAMALRDVAAACFVLTALTAYVLSLQKNSKLYYFAGLFFFVLSLLTKPYGIILPVLMLLLKPFVTQKDGLKQTASGLWPFWTVAIAAAAIHVGLKWQHDGYISSLQHWTLKQRAMDIPVLYAKSLWRMIWPVDLALLYPRQIARPLWQWFASLGALGGISYLCFRARANKPYVCWGWLWCLSCLALPVCLVSAIEMADRYCYLPVLGLLVMAVWLFSDFSRRFKHARAINIIVMLAAAVVLGKAAYVQVGYWRSDVSLFEHNLKVTRNNYVAHVQLGVAYNTIGDKQAALEQFGLASQISRSSDPRAEDKVGMNNLGVLLDENGFIREAEQVFIELIRAYPEYPDPKINLARLYERTKRFQKAKAVINASLKRHPGDPELLYIAASSSVRLCDFEEALKNISRITSQKSPFFLPAMRLAEVIDAVRGLSESERLEFCTRHAD